MNNPIFCTAPFTTLRIESYSPGKLGFKPGCIYAIQDKCESLDEFFSGEEMTALRNNKLTGTVPDVGCANCANHDKMGIDSVRKKLLRKPWASDQLDIKLLDLFFSNTCNLGCFMCDETISTFVATERKAVGLSSMPVEIHDNTDIALETIDRLPNLESVSFIGGEFFVFKKNIELLDKIIQRQLECRVVTNASVVTPILLERLKQIPSIELTISMDGVNDAYSFMRYPATWENFTANVSMLKQHVPHAKINFNFVLQVLNINNLYDTFDWANRKMIPIHVAALVVVDQGGLGWTILNQNEKNDIVKYLEDNKSKYRITKQQTEIVDSYISGIQKSEFDQTHRKSSVDMVARLIAYRNIAESTVRTQLGVFVELADEIIQAQKTFDFTNKKVYTITNETSNNCNQGRS
jgi:MoaA/NifB/PqqE/SkfB family radical SAM enzyme